MKVLEAEKIPLKKYINTALESCDEEIKALVIRYTNTQDELHQNNNFIMMNY